MSKPMGYARIAVVSSGGLSLPGRIPFDRYPDSRGIGPALTGWHAMAQRPSKLITMPSRTSRGDGGTGA